jgi:hypothetical protein
MLNEQIQLILGEENGAEMDSYLLRSPTVLLQLHIATV